MYTNFELFQLLTEIPPYSFKLLIDYVYIIEVETTFYESGNVDSITPFLNGEKHGLYQEFYDTGSLLCEFMYVYGKKHGIVKGWHKNGSIFCEIPYVEGKEYGISKWWDSNGNLVIESTFVEERKTTRYFIGSE